MISALTIVTYIATIFIFQEITSYFSQWGQLIFEILFSISAITFFYKKKYPQRFFKRLNRQEVIWIFTNLLLGFTIYLLAKPLGMVVPFDFSQPQTYLWLILIAPLIEEIIFRHVLFESIQKLIRRSFVTILMTSLLFSYAHLRALIDLGQAPEQIQYFVVYQGIYTFLLSLIWGYYRHKSRSLLPPILMHLALNVGFGMASLL